MGKGDSNFPFIKSLNTIYCKFGTKEKGMASKGRKDNSNVYITKLQQSLMLYPYFVPPQSTHHFSSVWYNNQNSTIVEFRIQAGTCFRKRAIYLKARTNLASGLLRKLPYVRTCLASISLSLRVTALLCASSPSTSAMVATYGPSFSKPSSVKDCTVMYLRNESKDTPPYILA